MFHYFRSEPRVWTRQRSGFRMSGGWTTAKRGTVPVPRRFDSKQLTVAPQLLSKLPSANMPACQACMQAQVTSTLVSVSQSAASQVLSTCHLKLQKREREGRHRQQLLCGAAVAANKAASAGSAYAAEQSTNNRVNILPTYLT